MKRTINLTLLTLLLLILPATALAQTGQLGVKIIDAEIATLPIAGAIIEITPEANPMGKLYYSTDGTGSISVPALQYGDYNLSASFLGYETAVVTFTISTEQTQLPVIKLASSSVEMETVVKTTKAMRASQKGDTLSYSASSFKVASDADVEGLLEKMPGIAIEDGTVTAQGEEIKKIYVDGREFFGNDVATALKSLPAEVVARIEVYDKLSDSAEASGMDDGEGEKTINIVTHENMRKGVFGKTFVGGGYEPEPYGDLPKPKYMAGGSVNLFRNTSRISVIALSNNINQQNFSFEDIMGVTEDNNSSANGFMVKQLPGTANVNAVGVNYSDVFGEDDKIKLQASYFFNRTYTTNEEHLMRWYDESYDEDIIIIDSLEQSVNKLTENINHRLNGRIDWKINKKSSLMIRPSLSVQVNDYLSDTDGMRFDESQSDDSEGTGYLNGYNRYDIDGNRLHGQQAYASISNGRWVGFNVGTYAYYHYYLGDRRSINANAGFTINEYDSDSAYNNELYWVNNNDTENDYTDYYTYSSNPSYKRNLNAGLGYTEPLANNLTLNLSYRFTQNYQDSNKSLFITDDTYTTSNENLDENSSSKSNSTYNTHRAGPGMRYAKGKTNIVANVYYQSSEMINETTSKGETIPVDETFENITYSIVGQANFNAENSLRMNIYSYTSNPVLWRMQNVLNNPSSDYLVKGNPNLIPEYNNQVRLRYINSNLEKARTLMWMLSATRTDNYFATQTVTQPNDFYFGEYHLEDRDQYSTYVNIDGYWRFYTRLSYGLPLDFMKCNLNFNVGMSYSIVPSIFGGEVEDYTGNIINGYENNTDNISYKAGFTLGSNISENVDFTLKWWGNFNKTTNVAASDVYLESINRYYDQTASFNMKVVFLKGFTFTGNVTYKQYVGRTNAYNVQYTLCNAYIGHKIFRNKRGEITVGVNDALDQNTSFWRSTGSNYTQNTQNITIGRYYSAQFIYNLRYFGKGGSTNISDYKGMKDYLDGKPSNDKKRGEH